MVFCFQNAFFEHEYLLKNIDLLTAKIETRVSANVFEPYFPQNNLNSDNYKLSENIGAPANC